MNFRLPWNPLVYFLQLLLLCAALLLLSQHNAFAQAGQAEVTGNVTDEGGASVTVATVTLSEVGTNAATTVTTGDDGGYTATNLKPRLYILTVEVQGFRRFRREGVTLSVGERVRVDVALTVGDVQESVTVSSDASLLRTETGSLGQVIPNRRIVDLPLDGRNFFSLVTLVPGVAQPPPTTSGVPSLPRIGGGRPRVNEYLYDGISALQPEPGQVAFFPIVDAIQEFKVEINSPPAEFGRFNGGVVNLSTKSGTNEFRGSLFYFLRNEALNARNLFTPKTTADPKKPVFRRNQYGFVVGGPIARDHTFFFTDFQGTRQLVGRSVSSTVPTLAQRQGIFTQTIYDPATTTPRTGGGFQRAPFSGNQIPLTRIDPVALQLLNRYPLPNLPGTANNYRRIANERLDQDQFDVRVDHRFGERDQLFGRYSFFTQTFDPVTPFQEGSGLIGSGTLGLEDTRAHQFVGNYVRMAGITAPFTIPQFPFIQTVTQRSLDGVNPAFVLANGPNVQPIPLDANAGLGQGVFAVDRDLGSGYVQQWNVAVQRELTRNMVVEVAYAGSKITHVGIPDTNINQLTAEQLRLGSALLQQVPNPFFGQIPRSSSLGDPTITRAQLLRPYPRFTTVSLYRNNVGNTNYNSLQAKLEQRLSRGLAYLVSYTRSRLIDDAGSVFDASIQTGPVANFPVADSFNRTLERDVSTGDIPNVFVASFTYELPVGKGRFFNTNGLADRLLGGWSITGLVQLQSGITFPVTQITNFNAFAGFGTQRPNLVRDPRLASDQQTTARWFDTSAFTVAPQFTLGNSSRNPVRGPGYRTANVAFIKRTYFGEVRNFEFRAELFNLTNTPPLNNPNGVLGNAAFGTITSAGDPRVIQFGLKLNF